MSNSSGPSGTASNEIRLHRDRQHEIRGPAGAAQSFTYDAEGRVATAKEANGADSSYLYDADGNLLITKDPSGTTLSVGDMELFVPTGGIFASGTRFYSYNGQVIATRASSGGLSWKLSDHQGTTYATVDAANLAVSKRWQDPYGITRGTPPSAWPDKHGFVGGYQNTTGLTHLGARDYDPLSGRFLTADPVLNTGNPQALNAYSYANNSPISFSDPLGLMWGAECGPDGVLCGTGEAMSDPNYVDNRAYFMKQRGYSQQSIDSFRHIAANSGCKRGSACSQQRERARGHVKKYSPVTNDPERLISLFSSYAEQLGGPRDFWDTATGEGDEKVCFGIRGCREAWIYLLGHGNDVAGAKAIAALYCVEHFAECRGEKVQNDIVMEDMNALVMLGAAGIGGGLAAADEAGGGVAAAEGRTTGSVAAEEEGGVLVCANSFSRETLVLMGDRSVKPIDQVVAGDSVVSRDPAAGHDEVNEVVATIYTEGRHAFVDLSIDVGDAKIGTIRATTRHRFWDVTDHRWVFAEALAVGHEFLVSGTGSARLANKTFLSSGENAYNFTVENLHTYYVMAGSVPVLVHNAACQHTMNFSQVNAEGETVSHGTFWSGNMTAGEKALGFPLNTLATHTEVRALNNLAISRGDTLYFEGQLPPCNSCKGAMNKAVRERGVQIIYGWGNDTWMATG